MNTTTTSNPTFLVIDGDCSGEFYIALHEERLNELLPNPEERKAKIREAAVIIDRVVWDQSDNISFWHFTREKFEQFGWGITNFESKNDTLVDTVNDALPPDLYEDWLPKFLSGQAGAPSDAKIREWRKVYQTRYNEEQARAAVKYRDEVE